jgi:hypothetical protein
MKPHSRRRQHSDRRRGPAAVAPGHRARCDGDDQDASPRGVHTFTSAPADSRSSADSLIALLRGKQQRSKSAAFAFSMMPFGIAGGAVM